MSAVDLGTPVRRAAVATAPWDDGLVLFDLRSRRLHHLNPTGAAVWELLDGRARATVIGELAQRFEVGTAVIERDVDDLLGELIELDLIGGTDRAFGYPSGETPGHPVVGPCYRAGGFRFVTDVDDAELAAALSRLLEPLRDGRGGVVHGELSIEAVDDEWRVSVGTASFLTVGDRRQVIDTVVAECNRRAVAADADHVGFHAGVVCGRSGAVLLPGVSGAGKSTLTAALVAAGAGYLTDEAALLHTATGLITPFPKALSLDHSSRARLGLDDVDGPVLGAGYVEPARLGHVGRPAPVAAVVAPRYEPGATTTLEPVAGRDALELLLSHTFDFATAGEPGFRTVVRLAQRGPVYRLVSGDLDEAVAAVTSLL